MAGAANSDDEVVDRSHSPLDGFDFFLCHPGEGRASLIVWKLVRAVQDRYERQCRFRGPL